MLVNILNEVGELSKHATDGFKEIKAAAGTRLNDAKAFLDSVFEDPDKFYNSYEERIKHTPVEGERGQWEGERGESKFKATDYTEAGRSANEALKEFGLDGIEYKNAEPDFSECTEATVKIDNMTEWRESCKDASGNRIKGNFEQADEKCADKWNTEKKDGRTDWSVGEVKDYRKDNSLSWHERCDKNTMDLVPQNIHNYFTHSGGVSECRIRDNSDIGGGFDE